MLVHLAKCPSARNRFSYPGEMTQQGISDKLGVRRGYVASELIRLRDSGHVDVEVKRVAGARKRRKVYFLTDAGRAVAKNLAEQHIVNPRSDGEDARSYLLDLDEEYVRAVGDPGPAPASMDSSPIITRGEDGSRRAPSPVEPRSSCG